METETKAKGGAVGTRSHRRLDTIHDLWVRGPYIYKAAVVGGLCAAAIGWLIFGFAGLCVCQTGPCFTASELTVVGTLTGAVMGVPMGAIVGAVVEQRRRGRPQR